MKNLFLALAFIFIGSTGFANENSNWIEKDESLTALFSDYNQDIDVNHQNTMFLKQCRVKIKGTVNGKPVELDVEFTADDCIEGAVELIKGVVEEILDEQ